MTFTSPVFERAGTAALAEERRSNATSRNRAKLRTFKMIARRPVKVALSRQQMFAACGHRPETRQHVVLAADAQGKLLAIRHNTVAQTSIVDDHTELCGVATPFLYACPNVEVTHMLVRVNIATPTPMRAPGESPGLFAIESAMDELSYLVGVDPVELRLRNYAEADAQKNAPFSSKHLRESAQGLVTRLRRLLEHEQQIAEDMTILVVKRRSR